MRTLQNKTLKTAGLLVLKDRKLLLAFSRNKRAFYLPGGKTDHGETEEQALIREAKEELTISLSVVSLRFYAHISAPAFGEVYGLVIEQDCFLYDAPISPVCGAEIERIGYFSTSDYASESAQVPGVIMIMQQLKHDGLID